MLHKNQRADSDTYSERNFIVDNLTKAKEKFINGTIVDKIAEAQRENSSLKVGLYATVGVLTEVLPTTPFEAVVTVLTGVAGKGLGLLGIAAKAEFPILGKSISGFIKTAENTPIVQRLSQDVNVNPLAPKVLGLERRIGLSDTQNARMQADIQRAYENGAYDVRVNQQQVNVDGVRVGINRPDLQYTNSNGQRVYVEYDTTASNRAIPHEIRILSNDPKGKFVPIKQN